VGRGVRVGSTPATGFPVGFSNKLQAKINGKSKANAMAKYCRLKMIPLKIV
jgi:hypothetical protein